MRKKAGIDMRKIKTLCYCIIQGFRGVWKNRLYSLASAGTITACLFLLGIFYFVSANFNYMVKSAETLVGVTVFFNDGTEEQRILAIQDEVRLRAAVEKVVYISAEQAWETYKTESLNPELAQTFGSDNPLIDSASLEVYINDVSMQKTLVRYLENITDVRKVNHSDSIAESFSGIQTIVWVVSAGLIIILAAVALFLIRTTISMGINVRREEISIMSIIGATDFFIRAPFIVEGVIIGMLGSIIPVGILYFTYGKIIGVLREQFETIFNRLNFLEQNQIMKDFVPIALIFSLGIGFFASYVTSKRQIRKISIH